jgi:hypothetical protein
VKTVDTQVGELLAKAIRTQGSIRGLLLEDTPERRRKWGEKLYRAAAEISLTAAQYDAIDTHYEALQGILDAASDPILSGAHIFVQGSIRSRTTILPHPLSTGEHSEVDADAVVWLPNASNVAVETYNALEKRLRMGTRTRQAPTRKNRCVRLHYEDDSPRFHMDVTPARNAPGNLETNGNGALLVPDINSGAWKHSAPAAYADWFAEVCDAEIALASGEQQLLEEHERLLAKSTQEPLPDHDSYVDFHPLRAAVKLLKAHRDTMFQPSPVRDLRPISIVITTLAARAYKQIARESVITPRRSADALIEIVERMPRFIEGTPEARVVRNPVNEAENFAEKWVGPDGAHLETAFYDWHREAYTAVCLGLWRFAGEAPLTEAMRHAFGPRAARSRPTSLMVAVPQTTAGSTLTRAPKEQFIADMFPVWLTHELKIDCEVRKSGSLLQRLRDRRRINRWLPYNRQLRFYVGSCTVPPPYQLYWKVRNVGPAAERRGQLRGEITLDAGKQWRDEISSFSGEHHVEAYIVKNGVCVAKDRIQVPIASQ